MRAAAMHVGHGKTQVLETNCRSRTAAKVQEQYLSSHVLDDDARPADLLTGAQRNDLQLIEGSHAARAAEATETSLPTVDRRRRRPRRLARCYCGSW